MGVLQQSNRKLIGQAGFFYGNRALGEDFDSFSRGRMGSGARGAGQGLGYEAAQAAHDWFDRIMPGPLVAMVNAGERDLAESWRKSWAMC